MSEFGISTTSVKKVSSDLILKVDRIDRLLKEIEEIASIIQSNANDDISIKYSDTLNALLSNNMTIVSNLKKISEDLERLNVRYTRKDIDMEQELKSKSD